MNEPFDCECGGELTVLLEKEYPQHVIDDETARRDPTEQTTFRCNECGAEGRKFVDGEGGSVQYTGVLRGVGDE